MFYYLLSAHHDNQFSLSARQRGYVRGARILDGIIAVTVVIIALTGVFPHSNWVLTLWHGWLVTIIGGAALLSAFKTGLSAIVIVYHLQGKRPPEVVEVVSGGLVFYGLDWGLLEDLIETFERR